MNYIYDQDLEFLSNLKSEELDGLVNIILYGKEEDIKNKNLRLTEELSLSDSFKKYNPDHCKYWKNIASEIQRFGGNTFANLFRGNKGVLYREILKDVSKKFKAKFDDSLNTIENENALIFKVMEKTFENMSEEDKRIFLEEIGIDKSQFLKYTTLTTETALILFVNAVKLGGFKSYTIILQIANMIARSLTGAGLKFATNNAITFYLSRTISSRFISVLAGPIGIAVSSLLLIFDIASPAYRVSQPCVFQLIVLRRYYLLSLETKLLS